jgi:hypothetical protein
VWWGWGGGGGVRQYRGEGIVEMGGEWVRVVGSKGVRGCMHCDARHSGLPVEAVVVCWPLLARDALCFQIQPFDELWCIHRLFPGQVAAVSLVPKHAAVDKAKATREAAVAGLERAQAEFNVRPWCAVSACSRAHVTSSSPGCAAVCNPHGPHAHVARRLRCSLQDDSTVLFTTPSTRHHQRQPQPSTPCPIHPAPLCLDGFVLVLSWCCRRGAVVWMCRK